MNNLFLDDIRNPIDCIYYLPEVRYLANKWAVVKTVEEFQQYVTDYFAETKTLPVCISFDHDLSEVHYWHLGHPIPYDKFDVLTGYHAALWLKDFIKEHKLRTPEVLCHSMNPAGKKNILKVFGK